jgi:hypothetical protein
MPEVKMIKIRKSSLVETPNPIGYIYNLLKNYGIPVEIYDNKIISSIGELHSKEIDFNNTIVYYYYPDGFKQAEDSFNDKGYKVVHLSEEREKSDTYDLVEEIMRGLI